MLAILWKDLLIELRTKETLASLLLLGLLTLVVLSFAFDPTSSAARGGGTRRALGGADLRRHAGDEPLAVARAR